MLTKKQPRATKRSLAQRARIRAARTQARELVGVIFERDSKGDAAKLGDIAATRASRAFTYQSGLARRYSLLLLCLIPPLLVSVLTPTNMVPFDITGLLTFIFLMRLARLHPALSRSAHTTIGRVIIIVLILFLGVGIAHDLLTSPPEFTQESAAIAASSFVPAYWAWRLRLLAPRRQLHHPLDMVFLDVLGPAAVLVRRAEEWASPSYPKVLRARLNRAASLAQDVFVPRASAYDFVARKQARIAGAKLAAVLRSRNEQITTAVSESAYEEVGAWLADGIRRWLEDDLDEVIRSTPAPDRRTRALRVIRWAIPLVILIAAAFALPEIPPLSHATAGTASGIRTSLLVSAALYLCGVPISASAQVMGIMNKVN